MDRRGPAADCVISPARLRLLLRGNHCPRRGSLGRFSYKQERGTLLIEGELVAKSTGTESGFTIGQRVFHQKFGPGSVAAIDGNKLTVDFF